MTPVLPQDSVSSDLAKILNRAYVILCKLMLWLNWMIRVYSKLMEAHEIYSP